MVDSNGCKRNPFARNSFRPMVADLQNLSEIEKTFAEKSVQLSKTCPFK